MKHRHSNHSFIPLLALCVAILLFVGVGFAASRSSVSSALSLIPTAKATIDPTAQKQLLADLQTIFHGGTASVSIRNLDTNEVVQLNSNQVFDAASTSKIIIATYVYHQASAGDINLDDSLTVHADDIQTGTGDLQNRDTPFTMSYRDLVKVMLQSSDNTAAHVLAQAVGEDKVQAFTVNQLGLHHTDRTANTTTADDMRAAMEALYQGKVASQNLTNELLSYMVNTDFEDRLPADLPTGVKVYHKIGNGIQGDMDDIGIITDGKHTYSVAIYTSGFGDQSVATDAIAQASLRIYNYFNH